MKKIALAFAVLFCLPLLCLFTACKKETDSGQRYEITAEYLPENRSLFATLKFTYENKTEGQKEKLLFALYPNAYRKGALYQPISSTYKNAAYYEGDSYGEMVITSVLGGKSWQVGGEDNTLLSVTLETPLQTGDSVVLDISFVTRLAKVNHRTGVSDVAVNLGNFYPILCADRGQGFEEIPYYSTGDPFLSVCADYSVKLKLPKEYTVAATGRLVEERALESKKGYTFTAEKVRDFALCLSTKFAVEEGKVGKTKVRYCHTGDRQASEKLSLICEAVTYFSGVFGEYPYDTYTVAQTGFCAGGMEYPALTFVARNLKEEEAKRAIVHETAHQWWYAAVGSDGVQEAWQDEGLAEYSTLLFFEKHPKYGLTRERLLQESLDACRAYHDVYGNLFGEKESMSRRLDEYPNDYAYRVLAYDKGVVMLDNLRASIGDKKFFAALRKYYTEGKYRLVEKGALIGAFERQGVDAGGLFEAYLQGKVVI